MNNSLLQSFFGCAHSKTTFPQTPMQRRWATGQTSVVNTQTYIACLDCGRELPYSWESMRRIRTSRMAGPAQAIRRAVVGF